MLTCGSLFSGIDGFGLAAERAGMKVIWQSEIDNDACRVLARHWPCLTEMRMSEITESTLETWEEITRVATPGPYYWNTYSSIVATGMSRDDVMNDAAEDEHPYGFIASVSQTPEHWGVRGDELRHPQPQANARFIEAALNAFPLLIAEVRRLRAMLDGDALRQG